MIMEQDKTYVCCICGKTETGWGNDPWPVVMDEEAKCCDKCDLEVIVPARIKQLAEQRRALNEHHD